MTLWIGNGAVLESSSHWQLKEFLKLNNLSPRVNESWDSGPRTLVEVL